MKEMNEAEILARKIELKEQLLLFLTLLELEDRRKRLGVLRNRDRNERERRAQR